MVGAVSFHGGLAEFPVMDSIQHPVLVLSGGDDDAGTEVEDLEERLVATDATWQITRYSGKKDAVISLLLIEPFTFLWLISFPMLLQELSTPLRNGMMTATTK